MFNGANLPWFHMLGETYGENLGEISPRFIWIYMFVLKEKKGGLSLPAPKAPKKIMAGGAHPFLSGWQFSASISFRGSKCPNAARYLLVDVGSCCSPMCCTKQHGEKTAPKKGFVKSGGRKSSGLQLCVFNLTFWGRVELHVANFATFPCKHIAQSGKLQ